VTAFHRFDPAHCGFPPPRVPPLPPLRAGSLTIKANLLKKGAQWYRRGRYALARAYHLAGVGGNGALLAPAYHCRTMLDPAVAVGAKILLYPVTPDLAPDLGALEILISRSEYLVKALLVPHYFGFAQRIEAMAALCERHGVHLIEDCSHMLVGAQGMDETAPVHGISGHFGVASPYKFFPSPDGGLLWSNAIGLPTSRLRSPSPVEEMKAIANALAGRVQRSSAFPSLAHEASVIKTDPEATPREWIADEDAPSRLYDVSAEDEGSLVVSRWIATHTDLKRLAARRRENYGRWLATTQGLPACRPLFAALPDECVPYMFPLLIDRPNVDFAILKRLGMPIWRWDEMAVSNCPIASSYRLRLLHLPCHQELTATEMDWMTSVLIAVCTRPSGDWSVGVH
jgi:perosamine synthetase